MNRTDHTPVQVSHTPISRRDFIKNLIKSIFLFSMLPVLFGRVSSLFATPSSLSITHTVIPGETLWDISRKYNVSMKDILAINDIKQASKIRINQRIKIPGDISQPINHKAVARTEEGIYHTLERGDTLWDMSRQYGVSVKTIKSANNISSPRTLRIGQKIFIPMTAKQLQAYHSLQMLRETIRQDIALRPNIKRRRWKYIVLHHSATHMGNARMFNAHHKNVRHMKNGLAYHFVIDNGRKGPDGRIEIGGRWKKQLQGGHVKSDYHNQCGIGICLVGNFEQYAPMAKQYRSMTALVQVLKEEFRISKVRIIGHRDIPKEYTLCPGKNFPMRQLKEMLT